MAKACIQTNYLSNAKFSEDHFFHLEKSQKKKKKTLKKKSFQLLCTKGMQEYLSR